MKRFLPIVLAFAVSTIGGAQEKRVLIVQPFTVAKGIDLPYDM